MHHAALDPYQLDLICNGADLKIIKESNLIAIQVILLDLFANLDSYSKIMVECNNSSLVKSSNKSITYLLIQLNLDIAT